MIVIKDGDARRFPRRRLNADVMIYDHIQGRNANGQAVDVNPMGMLLKTRRAFEIGETVTLRFPSPQGDHTLSVSGEVVRVSLTGVALKNAVAVEFFGHEDWIFEELSNYVYSGSENRSMSVVVEPPLSS